MSIIKKEKTSMLAKINGNWYKETGYRVKLGNAELFGTSTYTPFTPVKDTKEKIKGIFSKKK